MMREEWSIIQSRKKRKKTKKIWRETLVLKNRIDEKKENKEDFEVYIGAEEQIDEKTAEVAKYNAGKMKVMEKCRAKDDDSLMT